MSSCLICEEYFTTCTKGRIRKKNIFASFVLDRYLHTHKEVLVQVNQQRRPLQIRFLAHLFIYYTIQITEISIFRHVKFRDRVANIT